MLAKEERDELTEFFDSRYKLKEECDEEMKVVSEKQSKHETQFAVINTKLSAILWLLGVVGAAVIGAIIKGFGG